MSNLKRILGAVVAVSAIMTAASASAQEVKHYRFAYDQPKTTGYGILGDIFSDKLKALSKAFHRVIGMAPVAFRKQGGEASGRKAAA